MVDDDPEFRRAVRRVLFEDKTISQSVPGGGKSAAETPERHTRSKITINLDGDVLAYFKEQAKREGRAYQSLINQVLREYVEGSRPEQLAAKVRELLLLDRQFVQELLERMRKEEENGGRG